MHPTRTALLAIDVQNDFCPGGALAVEHGDQVVAPINALMARFERVVLTQDWHPPDHVSFAANQPGRAAFESIRLAYGEQTLWPVHCVSGSRGAAFHPALEAQRAQMIVRKGFRPHIDSYSAFFDNDHTTATGLHGYLRAREIEALTLAGLATDYCVAWSALDAVQLGYATTVVLSACRAIDLDGSLAHQRKAMEEAGVRVVETL